MLCTCSYPIGAALLRDYHLDIMLLDLQHIGTQFLQYSAIDSLRHHPVRKTPKPLEQPAPRTAIQLELRHFYHPSVLRQLAAGTCFGTKLCKRTTFVTSTISSILCDTTQICFATQCVLVATSSCLVPASATATQQNHVLACFTAPNVLFRITLLRSLFLRSRPASSPRVRKMLSREAHKSTSFLRESTTSISFCRSHPLQTARKTLPRDSVPKLQASPRACTWKRSSQHCPFVSSRRCCPVRTSLRVECPRPPLLQRTTSTVVNRRRSCLEKRWRTATSFHASGPVVLFLYKWL